MSSIYKRKRNGKEDGYVMYSTYAFDPLKNKKRYYNITIGKLGPTLSWEDCKKQKKELDRSFKAKNGGKKEMNLNNAIETYLLFKKSQKNDLKIKSLEKIKYHLKKFNNIVSQRYGSGIMVKHIDIKILAWYYALRSKELKISSLNVHRRIVDSFFSWTKK
tara:strand:- start:860 stop:1342 length:483 start_codon:yes stop_codon:yes gene_type:complete